MDGFKDSTKMKYMTGGPVKKAMGGTFNEKGKRATLAEMEAEDRRMGSKMPTKKPMLKGAGIMPAALAASKKASGMMKKAGGGAVTDREMEMSREMGVKAKGLGAVSDRELEMLKSMPKKGVPVHSDKPMIRRKAGGLASMPKGKC